MSVFPSIRIEGGLLGPDVLDQLLARWPEVCTIMVTGYPSLEDMRDMFKRKAFDYLIKPFSAVQLRQSLNNAVDAFNLCRAAPDRDRCRPRVRASGPRSPCRRRD